MRCLRARRPIRSLRFVVAVGVISSLSQIPSAIPSRVAAQRQQSNGKARKVTPPSPQEPPPRINLPNLDQIRTSPASRPEIKPPLPSAKRSRNKQSQAEIPGVAKTEGTAAGNTSGSGRGEGQLSARAKSGKRLSSGVISGDFHHAPAKPALPVDPSASDRALARLDPFNQTGDQLAARDCEWRLPLLSLPGRAGLDLNLTLSYSSLVWTRVGNSLYFDEDHSNVSPGFSLGWPRIEDVFFDNQANVNARLLVTAAGRRVELRQVSANVYEAADSSYLQLTDNGNNTLTLRTTDGTQIKYAPYASGWQVTKITDRNGNYLSISNNSSGDIQSLTDTLGRVIQFTYDGYGNLTSINQMWNGVSRPWATFQWGQSLTMNVSGFSGVTIGGTFQGETMPVLRGVSLPDGSFFTFEYSAAAQVQLIKRSSSDSVERSHTAYDYDAAASDCPRLTQMRAWAENWSGVWGLPAEALTSFSLPGDGSHQMIAPDNTVYKDFYGSGWQRGLVTRAEVWTGPTRARLTLDSYTQDNPAVGYQLNPRVYESDIYDEAGNHRRMSMEYTPYGRPLLLTEYDGATPLRNTLFEYVTDPSYVAKRIVGLVYRQTVLDGTWTAYSRTTYAYDSPVQAQALTAVQHDQAFDTSFTTRGNVTSISRWDVTDIDNAAKALTTHLTYDAAGNLLTTTDAAGHTNSIGYADRFSDNSNHNTYAYATSLTDAGGYSTALQYNYDFGGQTWMQGPPVVANQPGLTKSISYDEALRPQQITTVNTGAYVRYGYGPNYRWSLASINTPTDEAYTIDIINGLGLVTVTVRNHPGSTGGYSAQPRYYDVMGRPMIEYNPREIDANWQTSGNDDTGWYFSRQTYDWKNRPLVTTNQDGTQRYAVYSGCGCAGGAQVTLTDEVGRQQKVYADVLGRQVKTEVLNNDGSVYSTTTNTLNVNDQVTLVRQTANATGAYQDTTISYDGYARLWKKHVPEQNAGAHTVYLYNYDDTVHSITDARGVTATYGYNNRQLITSISYAAPAGITATPNVSLAYDAAGNRSSMNDGSGMTTYNYDQLSRLTSETRTFNGLAGSYTLGYGYNLLNEITSVTDQHSGTSFSSVYDSTGRVFSVSGSGYGGAATQFATQISYRAFGAPKSVAYGNNTSISFGYNSRGFTTGFTANLPGYYFGAAYQYYADGRLKFAQDQSTYPTPTKDRAYNYDQAGRLSEGYSGAQARDFINNTNSGVVDGPYRQSYVHDAWGNVTNENWRFWSRSGTTPATFSNSNRNTAWSYDAQGNLLSRNNNDAYGFDAAGRQVTANQTDTVHDYQSGLLINIFNNTAGYDADGQLIHFIKARATTVNGNQAGNASLEVFDLRSTALGGRVISEYDGHGVWQRSYVYAASQRIGEQGRFGNSATSSWRYVAPGTGDEGGSVLDPNGVDVGLSDPFPPDGSGDPDGLVNGVEPTKNGSTSLLAMESGGAQCVIDGIQMDCSFARGETTVQCPDNDCGPRMDKKGKLTDPFQAFVDGHAGFLPHGAKYLGNGNYLTPPDADNPDGGTGQLDQNPEGDTIEVVTRKDLTKLVREFYSKFGKKFNRCLWSTFKTDKDGHPLDVAKIMQRQTFKNAPLSSVVLGHSTAQIGGQGRFTERSDGSGVIEIAADLRGALLDNGRQVFAKEAFFRVYAHETTNFLSWQYTGSSGTFGSQGIRGQAVSFGVHSGNVDDDSGARQEKCMWGDVDF
jgi:YD repeat-containing protein